jgi:ATP-binding cassette subfamily F protein uup
VFLDNVVTSTFVFEGDGRVQEFVGGYEDWLRQRKSEVGSLKSERRSPSPQSPSPRSPVPSPRSSRKLSYKEQRELEALPSRIEALEFEQRALAGKIAGADFYKESAEAIKASLARVEELQRELTGAYARWGELDARR